MTSGIFATYEQLMKKLLGMLNGLFWQHGMDSVAKSLALHSEIGQAH